MAKRKTNRKHGGRPAAGKHGGRPAAGKHGGGHPPSPPSSTPPGSSSGGGHPASPPSFPPPPPLGSSRSQIAHWLGRGGVILVLFETPSGFALLRYNATGLFCSGALENTWVEFTTERRGNNVVYLVGFLTCKDKSVAINPETGLSDDLSKMIRLHHRSGQKLAVGKSDYKKIIEAKMEIHCLFDDAVMELMWGLQNLIKSLVPHETCELTMEDRCPMSQGMQMILKKHGFNVEPEMVDKDVIAIATAVYECDYSVNRFAEYLHIHGKYLFEVSGIEYQNWDLQKIAAALKLLSYPTEKIETGTSDEMLSEDMAMKLVLEAPKYESKVHKRTCLDIYKSILLARAVRSRVLSSLKAKIACATQISLEGQSHG